MNALAPIGRVMFSLIFLLSVPNHFKQQTIDYAAAAGVPVAHVAVPLAGLARDLWQSEDLHDALVGAIAAPLDLTA